MAFDYKKEYKEFYLPKAVPGIITIPEMNYIAVRGQGDPNAKGGEYKASIELLYGIAFTIKMSKRGSHQIDGYFDYVVPSLEGFWRQKKQLPENGMPADIAGKREDAWKMDYTHDQHGQIMTLVSIMTFIQHFPLAARW